MADTTTPAQQIRAEEICAQHAAALQGMEALAAEALEISDARDNRLAHYILKAAYKALAVAHKHFDKVRRIHGMSEGGKG